MVEMEGNNMTATLNFAKEALLTRAELNGAGERNRTAIFTLEG